MIILERVSKTFADSSEPTVADLDLQIASEETLVIVGSSGCGKTTTLKMINRLVEPTSGRIVIDGEDILRQDPSQLRRSIGYVFQQIGLFPHMTVAENISVVLRLLKRPASERRSRAFELLSFVNLDPEEFADRLPAELSGGQQQRVGVARALANRPRYLLMDEPFGAIDSLTRDSLQQDFIHLRNKLGITVVFVTHDVFEALRIATRIAVMDKGRLQQVGTPEEIINHPANDFVRDLIATPVQQIAHYEEHLK